MPILYLWFIQTGSTSTTTLSGTTGTGSARSAARGTREAASGSGGRCDRALLQVYAQEQLATAKILGPVHGRLAGLQQ